MFGQEPQGNQQNRFAARSASSPSQNVSPIKNSAPSYSESADRPTSILGPDITISGQQLVIKTKGSLLIQGQIQGDVQGEAVTVEDGANVDGVVTAKNIVIHGGAKGSLKGSTVILHSTSIVDADIVHQTLSIEEGAQFEGAVRRAKDISEVTPDLK
jgi:cytoskeletal protein CcmA (bactofilin family)